ncbi:MAG: hypothetical protein KatS3mg087_0966 [Patescibacteria group bacterium]|nr:MAG: hypothetical protein KatS3mg087_0966 [Patescibacteria group bacterium]
MISGIIDIVVLAIVTICILVRRTDLKNIQYSCYVLICIMALATFFQQEWFAQLIARVLLLILIITCIQEWTYLKQSKDNR